ncbi:pilus assembly protein [Sphingomonas sp. ID1715]|uniref:TadE/TadG family type IV pilus assembly protein n=1 Tax=Sphingomonas sp. ID1715 TaxID=1656898 RepID=UPI0014893048|nr:TadE family protein [Sphingomonas sp. ID1715]NNM77935.1 pilus assembly protein [Sphingomonas sp. ID1715]
MRMLIKDRNGIATMEFALIAPVITVLLFGFLEFAWVESARSALESSTMKAARLIAASDCPANRETQMIQTITRGMQHVPSSDGQGVTIKAVSYGSSFGDVGEPEPFVDNPATKNGKYDVGETFTDVNGNGKWDPDMGTSGSVGGAGQVVSYTATFRVKSLVPWIASRFGDGGPDYPIKASTVIRNEPIFRNTGC